MSDSELIALDCMENGHDEGEDGVCLNCNEVVGICKVCGDDTNNVNLLCDDDNGEMLALNDRQNDDLRAQYGSALGF